MWCWSCGMGTQLEGGKLVPSMFCLSSGSDTQFIQARWVHLAKLPLCNLLNRFDTWLHVSGYGNSIDETSLYSTLPLKMNCYHSSLAVDLLIVRPILNIRMKLWEKSYHTVSEILSRLAASSASIYPLVSIIVYNAFDATAAQIGISEKNLPPETWWPSCSESC